MTKPRVALWDNTRFVAIVLVVLGHALTRSVSSSNLAAAGYFWIYAFHIPLFVMLAGFFSRSDPLTKPALSRVLTDLIVPYLLFEIVWSAIHAIGSGSLSFDPLRPSWTLWFLLSLAAWKLFLPLVALTRYPVLVSVLIGVSSGYFEVDQTLSLSRTLALLPFFVLGWRVSSSTLPQALEALRGTRLLILRGGSAAIVIFSGILAYQIGPLLADSKARWMLTYDRPYEAAAADEWWSAGVRLGLYLIAVVLTLAIVSLIPRRQMWFTSYGRTTMYVYLLHSFPIAALRAAGILTDLTSIVALLLLIPGAVALSLVLGSPLVVRVMRGLVQPQWAQKLFR